MRNGAMACLKGSNASNPDYHAATEQTCTVSQKYFKGIKCGAFAATRSNIARFSGFSAAFGFSSLALHP